MWWFRCELAMWIDRFIHWLGGIGEAAIGIVASDADWEKYGHHIDQMRQLTGDFVKPVDPATLHPRNHADNCGFHLDQYPWECTCGLINASPPWKAK